MGGSVGGEEGDAIDGMRDHAAISVTYLVVFDKITVLGVVVR